MPVSQLLLWYLGTSKGPKFKGSSESLTPGKRLFLNKTKKKKEKRKRHWHKQNLYSNEAQTQKIAF